MAAFKAWLKKMRQDADGPDRTVERSLNNALDTIHGDVKYDSVVSAERRVWWFDHSLDFVKTYCRLYDEIITTPF